MKKSGSHFYTRVASSANEDISERAAASLRVGKSAISSPLVDSHIVASIHYNEFTKYLTSYLEKG